MRREVGVVASDDLTTSLIGSMVAGAPLSDADIVSLLRNWTAGQGTVVAALGILVYHLAAHADVQQQLRREPMLLPAAIEEMLRADGPLVANRRTTTRDVAIGGRKIGAGEKLSLVSNSTPRSHRKETPIRAMASRRCGCASADHHVGVALHIDKPICCGEEQVIRRPLRQEVRPRLESGCTNDNPGYPEVE